MINGVTMLTDRPKSLRGQSFDDQQTSLWPQAKAASP